MNDATDPLRQPSITYDTVPLNQEQASIRLFTMNRDTEGRIHGFLEAFDLGTRWAGVGYTGPVCPKYIALSYAWGESYPVNKIFLQNVEITVRSNLFEALNAIMEIRSKCNIIPSDSSTNPDQSIFGTLDSGASSTPIRHYWIDALCIDQANIAERNHQVGLMGSIYSEGALVISWLGSADEGLQAAMRYISGVEPRRLHTRLGSMITCDKERNSVWPFQRKLDKPEPTGIPREHDVLRLCNLEYFRRMWILQEIILARENLLLCGQEFICIPSTEMMDVLEKKLQNPVGPQKWYQTPFWKVVDDRDANRFAVYNANGTISVRSFQLPQMVCQYGSQKCQDPRDRVFALLGFVREPDVAKRRLISRNGLKIEADYACSPFELLLRIIALPSSRFIEEEFRLVLDALHLDSNTDIPCELVRVNRQGIWRQMITSTRYLDEVRSFDWTIVESWTRFYEEINATVLETFNSPTFSLGDFRSGDQLWELQGEVQSATDTEVCRKIDEGPEMSLKHWARLTLGMSAFLEDTF